MELVLIGNAGSRRINFTLEAFARRGCVRPSFITYCDILTNKTDLEMVLPRNGYIRLESPSENPLLEAQLSDYFTTEQEAEFLPRGLIYNYNSWFNNYSRLLQYIEKAALLKNCSFINHPQDIIITFDKYKTKQELINISVPNTPLIGCVNNYDEFQQLLLLHKVNRAFLKPRYGSSASGVLAFTRNKNNASIITSVELNFSGKDPLLFNNLKLHRYTSPQDIKIIINELGKYGLIAEKWVPKNFLGDKTFDLRVFVINKKVRHVIVRTSSSVITNLHLGNQRGSMESIIANFPSANLSHIHQVALDAVNCFPGLFYAGVDIILTGRKCSPYVVEINGYGDMLLGDLCDGKSTYDVFAEEFENSFHINECKTN